MTDKTARTRAEKAQQEVPDNATCELCNRPIKKGSGFQVNPSGNYAHKDGKCPSADDSASEAPEVVRRGGDDEYIPVDRPYNEDVGLQSRPSTSDEPDLKGAEKGVPGTTKK